MKKRLNSWITSILGVSLFLFTGYLIYLEKLSVTESTILFTFSLALILSKDDLIKKFISKTLNIKNENG